MPVFDVVENRLFNLNFIDYQHMKERPLRALFFFFGSSGFSFISDKLCSVSESAIFHPVVMTEIISVCIQIISAF